MVEEMLSEMLLMYRRNRQGPRTVPCGTPEVTGEDSDEGSWTTTFWLRPNRKQSIHQRVLLEMP
ncbi:hypothetical protein DPMN_046045 [Dreissena polymorpha]|uniref:Uncharacterized protein n=1 Tax=Dreissena polymorpha TaxID=45954 RepID=A0A9D4D5G2_DREPO|nr:hypothetical protein DPMN_046045 [Dreissena polymorpha]